VDRQINNEIEKWKGLFLPENVSEIMRLYDLYRNMFIRLTASYKVDESTVVDIFQQSFIAFYENLMNNKIEYRSTDMRTYIFRIGFNKLNTYVNRRKETELLDNFMYMTSEDDNSDDEMLKIVNRMIEEMGEPCKKVLSLFYHENNSMREIAGKMNYSCEQVAKNRKNLCFKTLKENAIKKLEKAGLI